MNIISNNCAGAFVYKFSKTEFNNPFMWSLLSYNAFEQLCLRWRGLNFSKILLPPYPETEQVTITIDNVVPVEYIHIKYRQGADVPIKEPPNVYVSKPYKYACDNYIHRVKRMISCRESPVFLISDDTTPGVNTVTPENSIDLIRELNERRFEFRIVWATPNVVNLSEFSHLNMNVIHPESQFVIDVAQYIVNHSIIEI